ncbi:MAG: pyridine nucleotide-disulfide oxidoreductase [Armatimonadetes bacterium]|nr:pyridine nucleotide-disulfide oxidoreductase [Armatimonadota bacterium]
MGINTAARTEHDFELGIPGFLYSDLYRPERLADLTAAFHQALEEADPALAARFKAYRESGGEGLTKPQEGDLLIEVARHQSRFIARLFRIEDSDRASRAEHEANQPVFRYKKELVGRRALKKYKEAAPLTAPEIFADDGLLLKVRPDLKALRDSDPELLVATVACDLLDLEAAHRKASDERNPEPLSEALRARTVALRGEPHDDLQNLAWLEERIDDVARWSANAFHERHHHKVRRDWVSLTVPEDLDWPDGLVPHHRPRADLPNAIETPPGTLRLRDGFKLTDPRGSLRYVLDQTVYCVICHEREKDSCSRGLPLPRRDKPVQKNPLGVTLNGCPLDERISEMHLLKREGDTIGSLAMVMVDNPMCPTTGHRICNDCMKGCIYQKQEPVNIPQNETRSLMDTLNLPWGFEIYGLLTRWNPINVKRPHAAPYNGKNVLVVGLGPAGFSLAQYLLQEGFGVVSSDGLKIEPLPQDLIGSEDTLPRPIRDWSSLVENLDERVPMGFGGVAEYGITIRWDKNFLKLIYITLMRRNTFRVYGGVRFGGTLTAEDAWDLGFDHVAIAAGAGKPTIVDIKNNMIPGIRQASDFLMALQLTGAGKDSAIANLQLRLPALVIGGGLTGIDTATEAMAYYPVQVIKIAERHDKLVEQYGEDKVAAMYFPEEKKVLEEFIEHGRVLRAEREAARREGRTPDYISHLRKWGGVSLCYRKRMQDAPAYRLNHEEIIKALEEGITYVECLDPKEAIADEFGSLAAVKFEKIAEIEPGKWAASGEHVTLPARALIVAAGTAPNVNYERENPGQINLDDRRRFFKGFKVVDGKLAPAAQTLADPGFFTSYDRDGHFISYYGDNHPVYAGSVVKAVASGKYGAQAVSGVFAKEIAALSAADQASRDASWRDTCRRLDENFHVIVEDVIRLTPTIVEVIVRAPLAARKFHPGQFYRLQNFETQSPMYENTRLAMEGVALTGAWVDKEKGLLSMIALELGVSSRLCSFLKKGERVIAMGPTGTPSEIGTGENVVLCGGGLGNAVLFSIAKAMKDAGNKVVYFAGYKKPIDVFHRDHIEDACHQVVWSVDAGDPILARRPQDRSFVGNIVQSMLSYAKGEMGETLFPMATSNRILAIGSDRMMAAVKAARTEGVLKEFFCQEHEAIASVNSPMQCMMKEICAQCLQRHIDPQTGKETFVFTCFNQDQKMDFVDWKNLNERLRQNTVQEKLANLWLDRLIERNQLQHV